MCGTLGLWEAGLRDLLHPADIRHPEVQDEEGHETLHRCRRHGRWRCEHRLFELLRCLSHGWPAAGKRAKLRRTDNDDKHFNDIDEHDYFDDAGGLYLLLRRGHPWRELSAVMSGVLHEQRGLCVVLLRHRQQRLRSADSRMQCNVPRPDLDDDHGAVVSERCLRARARGGLHDVSTGLRDMSDEQLDDDLDDRLARMRGQRV